MKKQAEELISCCSKAHKLGLITGVSGNASFLLGNKIYITASGTDLSALSLCDLAEVDLNGKIIQGIPSKELSAHRAIYNYNNDVGFVIHIHGDYIAAYTCIVDPGDANYPGIGPATPLKVGDFIPVVPYSHTNSFGDYDLFALVAKISPIFMQCNHGLFLGAKTADDALTNAINIESNMKVYMIALSSGKAVTVLTKKDKTTLFNRSYKTN